MKIKKDVFDIFEKDGTEFMMEWKIAPVHNEKNDITHYVAIQRNVSGKGF